MDNHLYAGDHPVRHRYSGCNYRICKDGIFICDLSMTRNSLDHFTEHYYIRENKDSPRYRETYEATFEKLLEEAEKEGAKIQYSGHDYHKAGHFRLNGYRGHPFCQGCSGCKGETAFEYGQYGDRTYMIRPKKYIVQCVKCGAQSDNLGIYGLYGSMRKNEFCRSCGRLIDRKKQREILKQIIDEDELEELVKERLHTSKRNDDKFVDNILEYLRDDDVYFNQFDNPAREKIEYTFRQLCGMFIFGGNALRSSYCVGCPLHKEGKCTKPNSPEKMTDEELEEVNNILESALRKQETDVREEILREGIVHSTHFKRIREQYLDEHF